MKYVILNDENGVAMLFHLNKDDVDLFVEKTRQINDLIPDFYNSTRLDELFRFNFHLLVPDL
ncbi:hypothetical protein RHMOL_Rhmol02G0169400 [Rhododendron molle]|uniref:Uncharacterized protein n=1 Tax=Rhododendron molle TaxID=49168 RepID=A0ACC0PTG9_RHOML|nr:hypothetical protein RHMOL_Rhmol02G0169400 [Rhododendron molle]